MLEETPVLARMRDLWITAVSGILGFLFGLSVMGALVIQRIENYLGDIARRNFVEGIVDVEMKDRKDRMSYCAGVSVKPPDLRKSSSRSPPAQNRRLSLLTNTHP